MYKSFNLDEIDFSQLSLIKGREKKYGDQDHSRWIFYDNDNLFYKIWNPTYIRRNNILEGIFSGFYTTETTPALVGTIHHEEICRGYIMNKVDEDTKNLKEFYKVIKQKTISSNYFYFDYCKQHIMNYKGYPCLIDLEGIYPLSELQNFLDHKYNSSFADNNYKEFVCSIVK